jgi:predicted O-methyltransferase YrrM
VNLTSRAKAVVPKPLWDLLKNGKRISIRVLQKMCGTLGLNVMLEADYYSPLPVRDELARTRTLWDKPSRMRGVEYNLVAMQEKYAALFKKFGGELAGLPGHAECCAAGFGPGFPFIDGATLYCMIRDLKPKRYLEVGSGLSTYYCSLAAKANRSEGHPVGIHCIEPYPFEKLHSVEDIQVTPRKVQEVDISEFEKLEAGDILFIDSSHSLKVGSDVAYLFMEVVPSLKDGVVIHVHDVNFPYNTPYPADECIFLRNWPLYFNEAMVVQSFLAFNIKYRLILSCPLLRHFYKGFVEQVVGSYQNRIPDNGSYSSCWFVKWSGGGM